jgi:nucleoside phosphorylase
VGTAGVYPDHADEFPVEGAALIRRIVLLPNILPGNHAFLPSVMPSKARTSPELTGMLRRAARLASADVACPLAITATKKAAGAARLSSGCELENLEAFAVARAAASAKVPFAAVLGVANRVGPQGHPEWVQHAQSAAENACRAVLAALAVAFE